MSEKNACFLGLINPKSPQNVGNVLRAAGCFGATGIFYTGQRYLHASKFVSDTRDNHERIPLVHCDSLQEVAPPQTEMVAIELVEGATPLMNFQHPARAFYVFGPEDGSLSQSVIDACRHVVYVPTTGCLNLSATVNVVLYDRLAKSQSADFSIELIRNSRDTNNRLAVAESHPLKST